MKKIMSAALALAMTLTLAPTAFAAGGTAYASTQAVEVDGKKVEFQMYALKDASGNGTNYVKLRDVAHVLNGTKAQFSVVSVSSKKTISVAGGAYEANGAEMTTPYSGDRAYTGGTQTIQVTGEAVDRTAITLLDDAGGAMEGDVMAVRCGDELTLESLNCPEVAEVIRSVTSQRLGRPVSVRFLLGAGEASAPQDKLEELIRQGSRYDSFTVK